ncbi:MAG: hypothetical protein DCC71_17835 [Proteobacteria bacterium]|nr:MAG: hypothetical protein DCC71_17835 [Pseudomonadota bacterium]
MSDAPAPGFDLRDAVLCLRRRAGWLALALALGVAGGVAAHRLLPPRYVGESTLLVESSWVRDGFIDTPVASSLRSQVQTLRHRLTSDRALAGIVAALGDAPLAALPAAGREGALRKHLELEVVDGASPEAAVVRIAFRSPDRALALGVVRASAEQLIAEREAERASQAQATEALLASQLRDLQAELASQARELDEIELARSGAALGASGDGGEVHTLRSSALASIQELQSQLSRAEAVYTRRHPSVKQLRAELARRRAQLVAPAATAAGVAAVSDEPSARYRSLLRAYDTNVQSYARLLGRQIEAAMGRRLEQSGAALELRVLREPFVTPFPSPAHLPLFAGAGGAAGLALGAAALLALALRRPSFESVERLAASSGLPVVAAIPLLGAARARGERAAPPAGLLVDVAPQSIAAEQYRGFLPYLPSAGEGALVLVTSAERGEGKSLTAVNLAASAALDAGRRVLLVDADLRCPTQHRLLRAERAPGLCEAVENGTPLAEMARPTRVANLFAVGAGRRCENPLRVLEDERFAALLGAARSAFDLVLVDAPPLLPVVDARLLARRATMIVFVVRADRTPRAVVLRTLGELDAPVGIVLNGIGASAYRRYYRSEPYGAAYPVQSGA